jgi:4-amino-4-deoxy-L-arabinose transferase-like glycosyltransferase
LKKNIITLTVFLVSLAFYLAFNQHLPITDPVESNYALTAREMVLSGNWLSPQIYGQYWYDKPIMIYWLIAGSFQLFGITDFAARFPAALFSALSVTALYRFTKAISGQRQALLSCLILGTSLEFWILAKLVITDSVMFFFSSVSLAWLYQGMTEKGCRYFYGAYIAAGLAVLTKGPVGLVLPGLIVFVFIALRRDGKLFNKLFLWQGLIVCFCVAAPWYYLMYNQHGADFINTFFGLHNYLRATVSEHPKDNVFYYYLVLFPVSLLPWTGLLFPALGQAIKKAGRLNCYLLAWLVTILVFYTLMATKYPTYVFPAAFPAAVLMGSCLERMLLEHSKKFGLVITLPAVLLLLVYVVYGHMVPQSLAITGMQVICLCLVASLIVIHMKLSRAMLVVAAISMTFFGSLLVLNTALLPLAHNRSAQEIVRALPSNGALVGMYGDYAASADYYSGYVIPKLTETPEVRSNDSVWSGKYTMPIQSIADFLQQRQQGQRVFVLMKNKEEASFTALAATVGFLKIDERDEVSLYELVP